MSREISNIIVAAIIGVAAVLAAWITAAGSRYERVSYRSFAERRHDYGTLDKWTGKMSDVSNTTSR